MILLMLQRPWRKWLNESAYRAAGQDLSRS
jgi:hypothetical protein